MRRLVALRLAHEGHIETLGFTSEGLLSATWHETRLWDEAGNHRASLRGRSAIVLGGEAFVLDEEGALSLRDAAGRAVATLGRAERWVVSPDGRWLGVVHPGRTGVSLWDLSAPREIERWTDFGTVTEEDEDDHGGVRRWTRAAEARAIAFREGALELEHENGAVRHGVTIAAAPASERVTARAEGATVIVHVTGERRALEGHAADVSLLALSAAGDRLASADRSGGIWLWDLARARGIGPESADPCRAVAVSPDGTIATGGSRVRLWHRDGARIATLAPPLVVEALAFSPDGLELVASGGGRQVVWDVARGAVVATAALPGEVVARLGGALVTARRDETAVVLASESMTLRLEGHETPVLALAVSRDGRRLASVCRREVRLWDARSGRSLAHAAWHESLRAGEGACIAIAPEGELVAACPARNAGAVAIWEGDALAPRALLERVGGPIGGLAVTPRSLAVVGGREGLVWDIANGRAAAAIPEYAPSVALDDRTAVTAGEDAIVWDLATCQPPVSPPVSASLEPGPPFAPGPVGRETAGLPADLPEHLRAPWPGPRGASGSGASVTGRGAREMRVLASVTSKDWMGPPCVLEGGLVLRAGDGWLETLELPERRTRHRAPVVIGEVHLLPGRRALVRLPDESTGVLDLVSLEVKPAGRGEVRYVPPGGAFVLASAAADVEAFAGDPDGELWTLRRGEDVDSSEGFDGDRVVERTYSTPWVELARRRGAQVVVTRRSDGVLAPGPLGEPLVLEGDRSLPIVAGMPGRIVRLRRWPPALELRVGERKTTLPLPGRLKTNVACDRQGWLYFALEDGTTCAVTPEGALVRGPVFPDVQDVAVGDGWTTYSTWDALHFLA